MPGFFQYFFFSFPRFFLTIIVVQNVFGKKPENVLRMPGFFPVLFSRTFSHTFFRFPSLFSYYGCSTSSTSRSTSTVVQVAWLPEVTEGVPWDVVRMRNRKLHNIRPRGAFSPEMTSSAVRLPLDFSYARPWGCSLGRPRLSFSSPFTGYLPFSPPFFMGRTFNRICCVVLQVVYHILYTHDHVFRDIHP